MKSYSNQIKDILNWIKNVGWTIDRISPLPSDIAGRVDYNKKTIILNCFSIDALFITLCHECGHILSFLKKSKNYNESFEDDNSTNIFYTKERREKRFHIQGE